MRLAQHFPCMDTSVCCVWHGFGTAVDCALVCTAGRWLCCCSRRQGLQLEGRLLQLQLWPDRACRTRVPWQLLSTQLEPNGLCTVILASTVTYLSWLHARICDLGSVTGSMVSTCLGMHARATHCSPAG